MIIGINGSPRKGNSFKMLNSFINGAEDKGYKVELIDACSLNISPCKECGFCSKEGVCRVKDEMDEIRSKLEDATHIAVCSPVFFFGLSAQLKILIDRCQPLWAKKYILKKSIPEKKGYFFSAGGFSKDITFKGGELTIKAFFDCLNAKLIEKVYALNMEYKNDIDKKKDILEYCYNLGFNL